MSARGRRGLLYGTIAALSLATSVAAIAPTDAGWLSRITRHADDAGAAGRVGKLGTLDAAGAFVAKLPSRVGDATPIAAHLSHEGHWTFVNRAGERFTAANPDELRRAMTTLVPGAVGEPRIALYIADPAALAQSKLVNALPRNIEPHVLYAGKPYRVGPGRSGAIDVVLRPGLVTAGADTAALRETLFHVARPLDKANVRLLALELGGPQTLSITPRLEPGSSRALIDTIDPAHLVAALGRIRKQTAVIVGDINATGLKIIASNGTERTIALPDLYAAAARHDVSLVILRSPNARQPGGRNWLWLKADVKSMDDALAGATTGDFLAAFARPAEPLRLTTEATASGRTALVASREQTSALTPTGVTSKIGGVLADVASELAGKVVTESIKLDVPSSERIEELDRRIVPWLHSDVQLAYIVAFLLGAFGSPVSRRWWQRIWPLEARGDYGKAIGYLAARVTRGAAFVALFMPLVAIASAPWNAVERLIYWIKWPAMIWRRYWPRTV